MSGLDNEVDYLSGKSPTSRRAAPISRCGRCQRCRRHTVYRKLGLCRVCRDELPGVHKSSW
ncbi:30S ribosomal protein S14 [Nocardia sp. NPDC059691]|uniref:30S ribosomal protein S14 n=1 Tax=Nocardia sp. NPDC059691 TaxID=3346908 RepID=UPI0036C3CC2C